MEVNLIEYTYSSLVWILHNESFREIRAGYECYSVNVT